MVFNLLINQKAVIDNKLNLDVIDCCLLQFMYNFINSDKMSEISYDSERYYFFNYDYFLSEVPILKINSKDGLRKRLRHLEAEGFIKRHPDNQVMARAYYKVTNKYSILLSDTSIQNSRVLNTKVTTPLDTKVTSIIELDNHITIDKGKEKKEKAFFPPSNFDSKATLLFETIKYISSVSESNIPKLNYIRKCIEDYISKDLIDTQLENYKNYVNYIEKTKQFVPNDPVKLIKIVTGTDWKEALHKLDNPNSSKLKNSNREFKTEEEKAYWELLEKRKLARKK